ncbi:MAG: DNRLRE domain-containing protein [Desulfitobacterium sp.]
MIKSSGITAEKKEDGSIEFNDQANGHFLFTIPRPYMFDSNKEREGNISQELTQQIQPTKDGFFLTLTADEKYLTDPERVYPVTIDPWLDYYEAEDTYIASAYPNYNYYSQDRLYVGHDATIGMTRSLVKWKTLPTLPNAVITDAKIGIMQQDAFQNVAPVGVHQVLTGYDVKAVNWASRPAYKATPEYTVSDFTGNYDYFNVTNLVKNWYANPSQNHGVMFKYSDANETNYSRRTFHSMDWINPNGSQIGQPKLVITFMPKELLGITDYWHYTPDIFNGEGVGVVNVLNGNFVYDIPILDIDSHNNAFKLGMIYNSRSVYNNGWGQGWAFSGQRKLILNSQNNVLEYVDENGTRNYFAQYQTSSGTAWSAPEGTYLELTPTTSPAGYKIKQPDQTSLYFDSSGRHYKTVDEQGYVINYFYDGSRPVRIEERYGSASTGRDITIGYGSNYTTITDLKGNETRLVYETVNGVNRLAQIIYAYGTSNAKSISFGYSTSHVMTSVQDAKGNIGEITYNTDNRVEQVKDPRSVRGTDIVASFSYDNSIYTVPVATTYTDANGNVTVYRNNYSPILPTINISEVEVTDRQEDGSTKSYKTIYQWDKNRVTQITEPNKTNGEATGTYYTASYNNSGYLESATSQYNNLSINNTFDGRNNVLSSATQGQAIQDMIYDSSSNLISASNSYRLTDYNVYDKGNLKDSYSSTRQSFNRLQNSGFEYKDASSNPTIWTRRAYGQYGADSANHVSGKYSGRITLSASDGAGYYTQTINVDPDESEKGYTVSTYVKTTGVTSGVGANLRVYPLDASGNLLYDGQSNVIKYESPTLAGKDWTRLSNDFTAPANAAKIKVDLLFAGQGTVYFDAAQLVYGQILDDYNVNENSGMEYGTSPDTWTLTNLSTGDGKSNQQKRRGSYSFKINGSSLNKYFGQYVEVDGNANSPLTVSGWAYATGTNPSGGDFALRVVVMNNDATETLYTFPFNKSVTGQWQMVKATFRPTKDFNRVKFYGLYYNQTGVVYYDNFKLEEGSALTSKTYQNNDNYLSTNQDELLNTTTFDYDANGNLTSVIDPSGKKATFDYSPLNLITKATLKGSTESEDITTSYQYDVQGNLQTRTDSRGKITTYGYNEINKTKNETDPVGKVTEFDYDNNGNLNLLQIADSTYGNVKREYKYDALNRLRWMKVNDVLFLTNSYNTAGDLTGTVTPNGTYDYTYDENHRLKTAREPGGFKITNTYSTASDKTNGMRINLNEVLGSINQSTVYTYDSLQRIAQVIDPDGKVTQFNFDEKGSVVRVKQGATSIYQDYDDAARLKSQTVTGSANLEISYGYNANGQVQSYTEKVGGMSVNQTFAYDFAKRLTSWTKTGQNAVTFNYDKAGNLLNPHGHAYTFNDANEINGFTYDQAGNLRQDNKYNYEWNGQGQLTAVKNKSTGSTIASYTYHPDGLRKSKTTGGITYNYHYDGTNLIRITSNNATVYAFTWANGMPVSLTDSTGITYYYVTNYRGDVVRIVDAGGNSVADYSYDPWGIITVGGSSVVKDQPIRYASYMHDAETNLYYLQARYYDPDNVRFISRDAYGGSAANPLSQNAYAYCLDDPINMVDEDGNNPAVINAVIRGVSWA